MFSAITRIKTDIRSHLKTILKIMSNGMSEIVSEATNPLKRASESALDVIDEKKPHLEFQRVKKRKYAVLLSYSGVGYLGLQRNPGMKTIEEDLLQALLAAGVINDEAYAQPKLIDFQRAARTDKGVSALRQVLSVKLPLEVCLKTVNSHLPEQIRMVALRRATKGFNCKGRCDARTYSYMMPSFTLSSNAQFDYDYRIDNETLEKTRTILKDFLGTHNFHNFTSKKKPLDPSAMRFIIDFVCDEPVICDGLEFVILKVKGQSFMLHQIRKMVGLIIAIARGLTTIDTLKKAWGPEKLDLPVAPGTGLVLEDVHYDRYNKKFGNDGIHDPIEWSKEKDELEEFKNKHILSTIVKAEKEENSMQLWLETLPLHSFDVRNVNRNEENKEDVDEEVDDDDDDEIGTSKSVS